MSTTLNRRTTSAERAPADARRVPSPEAGLTRRDAAGIVAWLVMLALVLAFLGAVGISALL